MRKNASRTAVIRRHLRLRQKITGTADRPHLSVSVLWRSFMHR